MCPPRLPRDSRQAVRALDPDRQGALRIQLLKQNSPLRKVDRNWPKYPSQPVPDLLLANLVVDNQVNAVPKSTGFLEPTWPQLLVHGQPSLNGQFSEVLVDIDP